MIILKNTSPDILKGFISAQNRSGFSGGFLLFSISLLLLILSTSTLHSQTTVTLNAGADSYIDQGGSSSNYGGNTSMMAMSWGPSYNRRCVIKFDLSSIPSGATITSATLKLHESGTNGFTRTINLHRMTASWSESSVTWSSASSSFNSTVAASNTISWAGTTKEDSWSLTSEIQSLVNGATNYGWMLKDNSENGSAEYWQFATKEHGTPGLRPVLVITYTSALTINVSPSAPSICAGGNVSLTASGGTTYIWSPSTGLSATTGASVTASPTVTTTYTVTGTTGSNSGTKTVTVTVNSSPSVSISPSTAAICAGGNIQLTASGASTYVWTPTTNLSSSTVANPIANPSSTTTYTVTGTVSNGCTATASRIVTVNSNPTVSMSNQTICQGQSATFDAGAGFTTYSWNTGATTRTITTGAAGTYSVTVTNSNGCSSSASATLTVNSNPTVSIGNQSICFGQTATFDAGVGFNSYVWNTGAATRTITIGTAGTYTATVTNTSGCQGSGSATLTVKTLPSVSVSPATATILTGQSVSLTASGNSLSYLWSPSSGLNITTGSVVTATPSANITYSVIGTGANGCTDTATSTITLTSNIYVQGSYAHLVNQLNKNLFYVRGNDLLFIYDEQYEVGDNAKLNYVIYDNNRNEVLNGTSSPQNAIYVTRGLNKNKLTNISGKLSGSGIYILEVTNSKNEKFYLRFSI